MGLTLFCGLFSSLHHLEGQAPESKLLHMQYSYIDGNNNVWDISADSLEYKPISKEMSSSGIYSGGIPFQIKITLDQYLTVQSLLQKGLNNTSIHLQHRQMGSGTILELAKADAQGVSCFLPMNSPEKAAIENYLKQLKK